ncbi:SusC/RagA family TonB-linked outer membrane protein [Cyclobacterium amurskyense]|uniref:TonB-dependent receptor plug n=1 Tax=Cyclobacterium amurskyense TaxID=320787 RepID=A0A0H4PJ67_9BACT|nr:TonB-dependent receptor [Cyclobacterium amurskyense]AKP52973.1 TonB-dependent receptor plug [Cyclobacterium amurskyense]
MKKTLHALCMIGKYYLYGIALQLLFINLLYAAPINAQGSLDMKEVYLSISLKEASFPEVFSEIKSKTDFSFIYDKKVFNKTRAVNIKADGQSLESILVDLAKAHGLRFKQVDDKISVRLAEAKEPSPVIMVDVTVSGTVVDSNGQPIPGVTVSVPGTSIGTATDLDGKYSISVPEGTTLVFSFIGFESQSKAVGDQSIINITLTEDMSSLDEVVVIGYGTQKQREVTGSIAILEAGQLEDQPVGQFAQKLHGRIPGVQINQASGTPGGGMAIRIRGASSINAGNDPLYVVDGFPIVGDINNINPNEIETFSVLKGASAASLYGSRAANGVVLITTKRAKKGETTIQFSASYGINQIPQQGRSEFMDAKEFLQFQKEIYEDKIKYEGYTGGIPELYQNPEQYNGISTDWSDVILRDGSVASYNLNIASGKDNFSTSTTAGYFKEEGAVLNTDFERFSLRSNNEYQFNENFRIGVNLAPTFQRSQNFNTDGHSGSAIVMAASSTPPIFSPFDTNEDGTLVDSYSGPGIFTQPNWYRNLMESTNRIKSTRLLTNAFAELNFMENFTFKSSISLDILGSNRRLFQPSTYGVSGNAPTNRARAEYATEFYYSWLTENTLNYNRTIDVDHNIDALVGYSAQKFSQENTILTGIDFPDDDVQWIDAAAIKNGSSNLGEWSLLSLFSRVNYNYKGKYLLSASIRRDGSSRFGGENQWGSFPAASAGWIISDEPFLSNSTTFSYLKLRAEYGYAGNFNIGNYRQFGNISSTNYVIGNSIAQGRSPVSIGNSLLTWETTRGMDIGLDISFLGDRIYTTFDYYNKTTDNMLYQVDIPYAAGFPNIQSNIGEINIWGYEFSIGHKLLTENFKWNTDFNISFNRNKVIQLGTNNTPIGGIGEQGFSSYWKTEVGRQMPLFYGYVFDGIYMTQEEFDSSAKHITSAVGTTKMKDLNDDGIINSEDKTFLGNPNPKFTFGFNNSFNYKNFDLNIVMSGAYGGEIFAFRGWNTLLDGNFNVITEVKDRWRSEENPGAGFHASTRSGTTAFGRFTSSKWIHDASYLTVKNLTFGYTLPNIKNYFTKARVYVSVQQALVITNYPYGNPEASLRGLSSLELGFDGTAYPVPRTIALGLNLNF